MNSTLLFRDFATDFNWLTAAVAFFLYRKLPTEFRWVSVVLIIWPFIVILSETLANNHLNNMIIRHLFLHLEFFSLSYFFYQIHSNYKIKRRILLGIFCYLIFTILATLFWEPFYIYPSDMTFLGNGLLCVFALSFFYKLYSEEKVIFLERNGYFILVSGLLFYFLSTLLIWFSMNLAIHHLPLMIIEYIESILCSLYIIYKLTTVIGLLFIVFKSDENKYILKTVSNE